MFNTLCVLRYLKKILSACPFKFSEMRFFASLSRNPSTHLAADATSSSLKAACELPARIARCEMSAGVLVAEKVESACPRKLEIKSLAELPECAL